MYEFEAYMWWDGLDTILYKFVSYIALLVSSNSSHISGCYISYPQYLLHDEHHFSTHNTAYGFCFNYKVSYDTVSARVMLFDVIFNNILVLSWRMKPASD
jgi:hypothetical protein